jgi:hypothetical protein
MPKIQLITDGYPENTTLIIDGVDVTSEYNVGWIKIDAFSRNPEEVKIPSFYLEYGIIESDPLKKEVIETATKKVIVVPNMPTNE